MELCHYQDPELWQIRWDMHDAMKVAREAGYEKGVGKILKEHTKQANKTGDLTRILDEKYEDTRELRLSYMRGIIESLEKLIGGGFKIVETEMHIKRAALLKQQGDGKDEWCQG